MRLVVIFSCVAVLLSGSWRASALEDSEAIIEEIRWKTENIRSYICEVAVERKGVVTSRGKIWFKSTPQRKKEEFVTDGMKWIALTSDRGVLSYVPDLKVAFWDKNMGSNVEPRVGGALIVALPGLDIAYQVEAKSIVDDSSDEHKHLISYSAENPPQSFDARDVPSRVEALYNQEHGYIEQLRFVGSRGQTLQVHTMKNYQLNVHIPDEEFLFTPPPDWQVVDKTTGVFPLAITPEMVEALDRMESLSGPDSTRSKYRRDSQGGWHRVLD